MELLEEAQRLARDRCREVRVCRRGVRVEQRDRGRAPPHPPRPHTGISGGPLHEDMMKIFSFFLLLLEKKESQTRGKTLYSHEQDSPP